MSKLLATISFIFIAVTQLRAQQPLITNIDPESGYPGMEVTITGSGFGTNPADLVVWFGSVNATINSVADNLVSVTVPESAAAENITVINLASGLSVESNEKFFPVYSGSNFDPSLVESSLIFNDPKQVYDPCTCDLDGNGLAEVITTKFENATDLLILENQSTVGNLSFNPISLNIGQPTVNVRCGDLNGDGKPDLYMSRGGTTRYNVFVLQNTGTPGSISFGALQTLPMPTNIISRRVAHGDLNGDGKPEIVVTNAASGQVLIFENTSSGSISFNNTPIILDINGASSTAGLAVQDIDGDGKKDIVADQFFGNDVFIFRNTGEGTIGFAPVQTLSLSGNALFNLTTGDFNGSGLLDIAVIGNSVDKVFVFENNSSPGSINFSSPQGFTVTDGPWGISTADVDGNGLLDIVTTSVNQNTIAVLSNQTSGGALAFTKQDIDVGNRSRNVWLNDLDGDAKPDFAITTQNATNPPTSFDVHVIRNKNCYEPKILNDQPLAICPGQTITLTSPLSPSATYSWTKDTAPVAGTGNTLDITAAGTYEVTATSESGSCITTASITVASGAGSVPGSPTASSDGPACIGGTLNLSVNTVSGAIYSWRGPDDFSSTQQNPSITNVTSNAAGIYYVTIQSGDCKSSESSVAVGVTTLPDFSTSATGATDVCAGNNVALSTQSRTGYSYQWLLDNNPVSGATSNSYAATQSGLYSVQVDDNSSNCQVTTNTISVNIYSPPVAAFSQPAGACAGQTVTFTNSSTVDGSAPVLYNWSFGDGNTSTSQNPTYAYSAGGNYSATLAVSYNGVTGCTDNISKGITINDPVAVTIESAETAVCPGTDLQLSVTGTFNSILWNTNETTSSITINQPGTYSVTVNDANGCDATAEIIISSKTVPATQASADKQSIFVGDQVQLQATGADTYVWTPATSLSAPNISNPIATPEQTTTYTVTGTNVDGCSSTAEITITVNEGGEVNITPLKAFSPNSTINPTWTIENVENYPDCTMSIFDERGTLVYRQKGYNTGNAWDATYKGAELPEGVYYYVFGCEGIPPKTGTVLVVR